MRRHHFLALDLPQEPSTDNISLLIGARANRERCRTPTTLREEMYRRISRHLSSNGSTATPETGVSDRDGTPRDDRRSTIPRSEHASEVEDPAAETTIDFLGRVNSYARLMHAHTKAQMSSPGTGTIPTYTKTMHAHTLNQLNEHRRATGSMSEATSPLIGNTKEDVVLQAKICQELTTLSLDEIPHAPFNTPEHHTARRREPVIGIDFGKLRRRSLTTPYAVRDFAVVNARDLAVSPAAGAAV